jgi:hypothetical protein
MHSGPLFLTQATGRVGALGYLASYSYVVASAAALSLIVDNSATDPLADGTEAVVMTALVNELWVLNTNSAALANGTTVVAALTSGRWIRIATSATPASSAIQTDVIYRPAVGASSGLILKTWAEVETAAAAAAGLLRVWMDPTGTAGTVFIPATAATPGRGMMEWHSATGFQVNVEVTAGGVITDLALAKDLIVESDLTGATPFVFNAGRILRLDNTLFRPTTLAVLGAMFNVPAATTIKVYVDESSDMSFGGAGFAASVAATGTLNLQVTRKSRVLNRAIDSVATAVVNALRDASAPDFTLNGAGTLNVTLIDRAENAFFDDASVLPAIVPTPVAGGPSIQQAIDALKPVIITDVVADGGYNAGTGVITITHNKGVQYLSRIEAYDPSNLRILPDDATATGVNTMDVKFTSFWIAGVLPANFKVTVGI